MNFTQINIAQPQFGNIAESSYIPKLRFMRVISPEDAV